MLSAQCKITFRETVAFNIFLFKEENGLRMEESAVPQPSAMLLPITIGCFLSITPLQ